MRKLAVFAVFALFGCTSASPISSKKTTIETPPITSPPKAETPLAQGQAQAEILKSERLPSRERLPLLRAWATNASQPILQAHALTQFVWLEDSDAFVLATKALESSFARVRTIAARALLTSVHLKPIRAALLDALQTATDEERYAILWALVVHGEQTIASKAVDELRNGNLQKVVDIDGRNAYEPLLLAQLFSPNEVRAFLKDAHSDVRQMAAHRIAVQADGSDIASLLVALQDEDNGVSAFAAGGLARLTDTKGHRALFDGLRNASPEKRVKWLEGIVEIAGGRGLVRVLESIPAKPEETEWFQTKQIFDDLKNLADPRAAQPLLAWTTAGKRHPHWLGEAGTRLAEIGDIRAAKFLGERMRLDPSGLYKQEKFWQADEGGHLSRTDLPRVVAARMLADLAMIHQDKKSELIVAAEKDVIFWVKDRPQPHANGLRFLAAVGSDKALKDIREWAFTNEPLPKEGASPPFPSAFESSQIALRYLGMMKDEPSFPNLLEQFKRKKDKKLDITLEALSGGGIAMLGMALRAVAYGAAQGLGEWGDPRANKDLMEFIEDELWIEESREAACEALAWCADGKTMLEVARKAQTFGASAEAKKRFIASCYAETLSLRSVPEIGPQLVDALDPGATAELRMAYGRAIGMAGFDAAVEEKLFRKLEDPASRQAAAIALILGGTADTAARAVATMAEFGPAVRDELKDNYYRAFGYWSDADFEKGRIYRWVANAEAIAHVEVAGVFQEWGRGRLERQFDNLRFDNGPHSLTRVVLRSLLVKDAKTGSPERKKGAILTLTFLRERGVLQALSEEIGEVGALAQKGLYRVAKPIANAPE